MLAELADSGRRPSLSARPQAAQATHCALTSIQPLPPTGVCMRPGRHAPAGGRRPAGGAPPRRLHRQPAHRLGVNAVLHIWSRGVAPRGGRRDAVHPAQRVSHPQCAAAVWRGRWRRRRGAGLGAFRPAAAPPGGASAHAHAPAGCAQPAAHLALRPRAGGPAGPAQGEEGRRGFGSLAGLRGGGGGCRKPAGSAPVPSELQLLALTCTPRLHLCWRRPH